MSEQAAEQAPDPGELEKTEGGQSDASQNSVDTTGGESHRDKRSERRIHRLTARNAEALEENQKLKARLDELETKVDSIPKAEVIRPQRENYETDEEYEDAYFDFRQDKVKPAKKVEHKPAESDASPEMVKRSSRYIADMEKSREGFSSAVQGAQFPLTEHSWNEVMGMGVDGADVFMYLDKNPKDAMRISNLSSREQTIELEKITDSLDNNSSAPDPISTVDGNTEPQIDESKLSNDEWIARRNRKVHGK